MAQMQLFLLQFLKIVLAVKPFFALGQSSSSPGDTIHSSLIDGQTLISAGSVFQLGFFSPINDSAHAYIGIWYYNLPPKESKVVVWVANRNRSVNASMASLNLTSDGNLILLEEGTEVWSTGTSAELNSARLQLLDSGNLALTAGDSNRTLWQSFDHACDTLLPGMKLGFDFRTNTSWQFVSWMSDTDPSPGRYIDKMEPYNVPEFPIVKVNGSVKVYRIGPWNGRGFVGLPIAKANSWNLLNFTYVSNKNEAYYLPEYKVGSQEFLLRGVQNANGTFQSFIFAEGQGEWKSFASFPRDECDYYDRCGRNSVCTIDYFSFSCRCLEGFQNKSGAECVRKEPLNYLSNQFWKEPNVKVPDTENATSRGDISLDACEKFCSGDFSCVAYAVINGPYGCITWRGDLLDIRSFTEGGDDLYIRLPAESSTSNWKKPLRCSSNQFSKEPSVKLPDTENATSQGNISLDACKKLCLDDCSCVAFAVINGTYGCITWRSELLDLRSFTQGGDDLYIRLPESSTSNWKKFMWAIVISALLGILLCCVGVLIRRRRNRVSTCRLQFPNVQKGSLDVLPSYNLHSIKAATNDFSEENKLGEGGFGVVYKGQLEDGQKIAVKKLSRYSSQGPNEFQNELSLIAKLQHRNLVRLLGCCIRGDERLIILEYMENKSLDAFIYDKAKSSLIDWQRCFDIIIGIARGLLYLHQDSRLRVVHRDLKPSNILLDKDMNPKISDFGIARIFEGDNALEDATTRPIGTFGYMAPEYLSYGFFSFKSDVFSFGVIVLEIISGKKNRVFSHTDTNVNLLGHAYKLWKEGRSLEILDNTLNQSYSTEEVLRCIQTSLLCVQDNSEDRPTMAEVVMMLASEDQLLTPLKQPTITTTSNEGDSTTNETSFTLVSQ